MTNQGDREGTGARWSTEQVLALAPDAPSRKAGSELGSAGRWSESGTAAGAVWGLCRGSGSKPYRTVVDTTGPAYRCSCPSRKFPCKHALGLLLLWSGGSGSVPDAPEPPAWAGPWLTARREKASEPKPVAKAADPEAARRRAERRAERVTAGAAELEQRLEDLVRSGLSTADRAGYALWEETAARMVDAQAPGLAARARELGAIPSSGPGWPMRLLEECALLHLLDRGWESRSSLPAPLAATVRNRIGLPAAPGEDAGSRVRDRWLVLAQYDTSDGKLTTRRIHLHGTKTGRPALVLSFGAAGRAPELALPAGLEFEAEAAYHPGSPPLRAQLGERTAAVARSDERPRGTDTAEAIAAYGRVLADDPWLESWPLTLSAVTPAPDGAAWQVVDRDGRSALPLTPAFTAAPALWKLVSLSGGAPLALFGELGHRGLTPLATWHPATGDLVPLY